MRKFDPWPVFFKREWNRNWPFLVGFAVTGFIVTKVTLGLTEEDVKNSPFAQRHKKNCGGRGHCEDTCQVNSKCKFRAVFDFAVL